MTAVLGNVSESHMGRTPTAVFLRSEHVDVPHAQADVRGAGQVARPCTLQAQSARFRAGSLSRNSGSEACAASVVALVVRSMISARRHWRMVHCCSVRPNWAGFSFRSTTTCCRMERAGNATGSDLRNRVCPPATDQHGRYGRGSGTYCGDVVEGRM